MTFLGQPLSSNIFLISSISPLSLCFMQIITARCTNVDIRLIFHLRGLPPAVLPLTFAIAKFFFGMLYNTSTIIGLS